MFGLVSIADTHPRHDSYVAIRQTLELARSSWLAYRDDGRGDGGNGGDP